jgi:hypothetical protein
LQACAVPPAWSSAPRNPGYTPDLPPARGFIGGFTKHCFVPDES